MSDILERNVASIVLATLCSALIFTDYSASAQTLPGPADAGRIKPLQKSLPFKRSLAEPIVPDTSLTAEVPDSAKQVHFHLRKINVNGVTAFSESTISKIYKPYLNRNITLDTIWNIAEEITNHYRNKGYFLSRAYVPAQEIDGGVIAINVIEGHIIEVGLKGALTKHSLVKKLISRLIAQRPLSAYELESFMLQLNELPGQQFRAVVEPVKHAKAGAVRLYLSPSKESGHGSVGIDNSGSRFLGPYQATATYHNSFLPLQKTTLSILTSTPTNEIKYTALRHQVPIYPDWNLELSGNYVAAKPGASLKSNHIDSTSAELEVGISWQPIRQWQENLVASLSFAGKNTNGDILDNNPLTRDRIRTLRGQISYDVVDSWDGYNYIGLGLNQGLEILGSSDAGDRNLSRAEAEPHFAAVKLEYTRQQQIYSDFMAVGRFYGQFASAPLFSAEEFGYGGQSLGRAYDPSEITGDHGMAGSFELRYLGIKPWQQTYLAPYTFYDIGKVWNADTGNESQSGSSAGLGMRLSHKSGLSSDLGLAWPLTKDIDAPIYGNGKNPRILFQISYGF